MLDIVTWYFDRTSQYPRLDKDKEIELFKRYEQGGGVGKEAKKQIIESNLKLVISNARSFAGQGLDVEDLIQEGNLALIRAVENYDYRKGCKFSTFATTYIRNSMCRALDDMARVIRLPVHVVAEMRELRRKAHGFAEEHGRDPSHEELADITGMKVDRIQFLIKSSQATYSLDFKLDDEEKDDKTVLNSSVIADENAQSGLQKALDMSLRNELMDLLNELDERQRKVIMMRFGLDGNEEKILSDIGKTIGVSREWVRVVEQKALEELKRLADKRGLELYLG